MRGRVEKCEGKLRGRDKRQNLPLCEPMHDALLITEGLTKDPMKIILR